MGRLTLKQRLFAVAVGALFAAAQSAGASAWAHNQQRSLLMASGGGLHSMVPKVLLVSGS